MPKASHGKGSKGRPAHGQWQIDNVNRARDNRRVLPKPGDRAANKASRQHQRQNTRATNKAEKGRKRAKGGGCAVTAITVGLGLAGAAARLRGWWT